MQQRKDDLESLGYMHIFFLKGNLPWSNMKTCQERIKQVGEMKSIITTYELCKGLPIEIQKFMDYVRGLHYQSIPNYNYLRKLLQKVA